MENQKSTQPEGKGDLSLVSIGQAARILEVSIDSLRRWEQKGLIKTVRTPGGTRRFRISDLQSFKATRPLTVSKTASRLGVSPAALRRLDSQGLVSPQRGVNGERLYDREALDKLSKLDLTSKKRKISEPSTTDQEPRIPVRVPGSFLERELADQHGALGMDVTAPGEGLQLDPPAPSPGEVINPKSEIPNPEQILNPKPETAANELRVQPLTAPEPAPVPVVPVSSAPEPIPAPVPVQEVTTPNSSLSPQPSAPETNDPLATMDIADPAQLAQQDAAVPLPEPVPYEQPGFFARYRSALAGVAFMLLAGLVVVGGWTGYARLTRRGAADVQSQPVSTIPAATLSSVEKISVNDAQSVIFNAQLVGAQGLEVNGDATITDLISCDSIDTDATGTLVCGVDSDTATVFTLPQDLSVDATPTFAGLNLTDQPLQVSSGGTGLGDVASGSLLYGTGGETLASLGIGAANSILTSDGNVPQWVTELIDDQISDTLTASIFAGPGSTSDAVDLNTAEVNGVLGETNGGTGQSAVVTGDLLYGSGADTWSRLGIGSAGDCLSVSGGLPAWGSCAGTGVTLQAAYDNSASPATITTSDGKNIRIALSDTATDQTVQISQAGTANAFEVHDDGTFADSTPFVIDSSGQVGIGTTAPGALLHVVEGTGVLRFDSSTGLQVITTGTTAWTNLGTTGPGAPILQWYDSANAPLGRIDGSGNVGIGDTSPVALLTVGSGDLFQVASNGNLTSSNGGTWTFSNDTNFVASGGVNGLSIDGTTFSVDATNDRIGIGTASPTNKLDVRGGAYFGNSDLSSIPGNVVIQDATASTGTSLGITTNGNIGGSVLGINFIDRINAVSQGAEGQIGTFIRSERSGTTAAYRLLFGTSDGADLAADAVTKVVIDTNGNLGIGDTSPVALLTVGSGDLFQVASNGNLTSSNGGTWTFSNDTNFVASGGVNGISFDGTTFSVDATNDRIGIGTASPSTTLHVAGGARITALVSCDTIDTDANGVLSCGSDATGGGGGGVTNLQEAYEGGNTISITSAEGNLALNLTSADIVATIPTDGDNFVSIVRADGAGTTDPAQLLLLDNLDTDRAQPVALKIQSAAGGITTALDLSDSDIVTALDIGANDIVTSGATISSAELDLLDGHGDSGSTLVDTNDAVSTAIIGTGALDSGSITSGFGSIDVGADSISTTGTVTAGTLSINGDAFTDLTGTGLQISGGALQTTLGTNIEDSEVDDNITISSAGSVDWLALTSYPAACAAGSAVSALADVPTCTSFNTDTSITLQDAYDASSSPALITTADGKNIRITLQDTATDQTFEITQAGTADILRINDDGTYTDTTPFVINASGQVGIGTPSPVTGFPLTVVGAGTVNSTNLTDSTSKGGRYLAAHYLNAEEPIAVIQGFSDSTTNVVAIGGSSAVANAATAITFWTAANNTTTAGTERVRIDSSGNVGIGDTSPAALFTVGSGDLFQVASNGNLTTSNAGTWTFSNDTNFVLSGGANGLSFDGTTFSVDATNDRIGLGTATPAAQLHVSGPAAILRLQDDDDASSFTDIRDVAQGRFQINKTANSGSSVIDLDPIPIDGTSTSQVRLFRSVNTTGTSSLLMFRGDGTASLQTSLSSFGDSYINALGGNVGIGDTSPAALLTVGSGDLFQVNSSGDITTASGENLGITAGGTGDIIVTTDADTSLQITGLSTATGSALCVDGSNNVVTCGTGSSSATLQSAYGAGNTITTTDARNIDITLADTATDQTVRITQAGTANALEVHDDGTFTDTTPFVIDASGNVGIGTSTPTQRLYVSGASGSQRIVLDSADGTGNHALAFYDGGTEDWLLQRHDSTGRIEFVESGVGSHLVILPGGSVGIGDTTPGSLFTVGSGDAFQVNSSGQVVAGSITSGFGSIDVGTDAISTTGTVTAGTLSVNGDNFTDLTGTGLQISGGALQVNQDFDFTFTGNVAFTAAGTDDLTVNTDSDSNFVISGLSTATGTALCVDGSNNVVTCGTGSSSATLQSAYGAGNTITTTDARNIDITLADTTTDSSLRITQAGTANALFVGDDGTFTDTTPFVIDASGNVGIGTGSPQTALHVERNTGTSYLGSARLSASSTQFGLSMLQTNGSYTNPFSVSTASGFNSGDPVNADFSGGLYGWTAAAGGLAVIGTSNASGAPAVSILANHGTEDTTRAAVYINAVTDDGAGGVQAIGSTNNLLQVTNNSVAQLTLLGSGNFGIGDSTPASLLTVGASDAFQVNSSGQLVAGSITSGFGAIDVGADNITTTGTVFGNTFDRSTAGALSVGGSTSTSVGICNSTACDAINIATTTDADTITIGEINDTLNVDAVANFSTDVTLSLAETENLVVVNTVTGTNSVDLISSTLTNNTTSGTQQVALLRNDPGSGTTETLLLLRNADTDTAVTDGLSVTSAAGAITDAIDVSDTNIVNALNVGDNNIVGTTPVINFTNFDLSSSGVITNATWQGNTVAVGFGGTGATTFTANGVLYGNGTSAIGATAAGTTGQCLVATTGSAPSWGSCAGSGSGSTLQAAYDNGNSITTTDARDIDVTLADTATDSNFDIDIAADNTVSISRLDNAVTEAPAQLLLLENLDANLTIADGIVVSVATGGVISDALDLQDPEIVNAFNIGQNFAFFNTLRVAELSNGVLTFEDSSGNDLLTITDNGTNGNLLVTNNLTTTGDVIVNGGDLTGAATFNLLNTGSTTINFGGAATAINIGDSTTGATIDIGGVTSSAADTINISTNSTAADTIAIGNSNASTTLALTGGDDWSITAGGAATFNGNTILGNASSDTLTVNAASTFTTDVNFTLAETENLDLTNTVTGTNGVDLFRVDLTNNTTSGSQRIAVINNTAGSGVTDVLLQLTNSDTDTVVTDGLLITAAAGGITDGIDVSHTNIDNALNVGDNNIVGTTPVINFTNFDLDASGNITNATWQGNTVAVGFGGTGATSLTANGVLYGNGTSAIGATAAGTTGQCLVATTGSAPSWGSCAGSGSGSTLQAAYDNGNSITTTDARDILFTLADTTTDSDFIVDLVGTGNTFEVRDGGTAYFTASDGRNLSYNAGNAGTFTVTSDLTAASTTYPLVVTQPNNATFNNSVGLLQLNNQDTASTAAVLNITQAATSGTGISFTSLTGGTSITVANTSGTALNANTVTTGTGLTATGLSTGNGVALAGTAFTTGNGILFNTTANAATTGNAIDITGAASAITADLSGHYINVSPTRTLTAATTRTDSASFLNLTRSNTVNNASGTYNITGDLVNLQSNCTQTAGTCTDTANILSLNQQYANASGAVLDVTGAGTGNLAVLDASNASSNGVSIDVQSSSSSQYALQVTANNGATTGLYVRADGNVGIGTASPQTNLHVLALGSAGTPAIDSTTVAAFQRSAATGNRAQISIISGNTGDARLLFGDTDAELRGMVQYTNSTDALGLHTAGNTTARLLIDSSGNVGIGDTSPAALLTVGSGDLFQVASDGNLTTSNAGTWTFSNDTNFALTGGTNGLSIDGTTLSVDATNDRIGIGTATPSTKLDVEGSDPSVFITNSDAASTGNENILDFRLNSDTTERSFFRIDVTSQAITDATRTSLVEFNTNNSGTFSAAMVIQGANVGIGDTSPAALFTVGTSDAFQVTSGGNITSTATGTALTLSGAASTAINISNTGVTTDINLQNGETIDNNTDGVITLTGIGAVTSLGSSGTTALCRNGSNQIADCTGAGANTLQGAYDGGNSITTTDARNIDITLADTTTDSSLRITQAGTADALFVGDDGTFTDTTPFVISANGDVGIGTTVPTAKLDVVGGVSLFMAETEHLGINNTVTGTNELDLVSTFLINNTTAGDQRVMVLQNQPGTGVTEAFISLHNSDDNTAVTDGLIVTANSGGGITDAIDASDADIDNALNAGDNFVLFNGIRAFSSSATVLTVEDTAGNDLITITDNGTNGNLLVTNNLTTTGDVIVNGGDLTGAATFNLLNTGTTTINFGSAATAINIGDSTTGVTIDIGGVTSSAADTINISTNGTAADTIAIGNSNASTTLALTGGDDWSITAAGAATFNGNTILGNASSDTLTVEATATFNTDVNLLLAETENLVVTNTVTGTNAVSLVVGQLTNNTTSGTQRVGLLENAAGTGVTEEILLLTNSDTDTAVTDGLIVTAAAGGITDAIDVSDTDIVNALNVGDNTITGTSYTLSGTTAAIDFTNFDVTSSGNITSTATGTALTLSGAATTAINISNTGVTTDINLQNGETIDNNTDGVITLTGIGAVTSLGSSGTTALCRNGSNQIADCTGAGANTLQGAYDGGNSITTTDARDIVFTLADTTTDSDFIVDLVGTGNTFEVRDGGTAYFTASDGRNLSYNAGNAGTFTVTSDLTAASTTYPLVVTQPNNASFNNSVGLLQLNNQDTASTAAVLNITQAATSGTGISFTSLTGGTSITVANTSGTALNANTVTTGTGLTATGLSTGNGVALAGTAFTTGNGILFNTTANAATTGNAIDITGAASAITADLSGHYINVNPTRTLTAAATRTDSASFLNLTRSNTVNNASGTYNITGDLVNLQSNCTQTAGTCTDTANILSLNQQYANASGAVLDVTGAGTGNLAVLDATNASANGVSIDVQSSSSSQYALQVTSNNGATTGLYVRADGNVGIGTATPGNLLSLAGATPVLKINADDNNRTELRGSSNVAAANAEILRMRAQWNGTNVAHIDLTAGSDTTNKDDGRIAFFTAESSALGPVERMRIDEFGNVGINTTSNLDFRLEVNGNIGASSAPSTASISRTATLVDDGATGTDDVGELSSTAIGVDGNPVISYYDVTNGNLRFTKCGNALCSSGNTTTVLDGDGTCAGTGTNCSSGDVGQYTSLAIGTDGLPVISYYDVTGTAGAGDLRVLKCGDAACNSGNTIRVPTTTNDRGKWSSIAIAKNGFPVVSYHDDTANQLHILICGNEACSSGNSIVGLDASADVGLNSSVAITTDGVPIVAYHDQTNGKLKVIKCNDAACSGGTITTISSGSDDIGEWARIKIGRDGLPIIAHHNNTSFDLMTTKCTSSGSNPCSSTLTYTLDSTDDVGSRLALAIGADGLPVISHRDFTAGNLNLKVTHCNDLNCSTRTNSTVESTNDVGFGSGIAIGADGMPFISHHDNTAGASASSLRALKCANYDCTATSGTSLTGGMDLGALNAPMRSMYFTTLNQGMEGARVQLNSDGNFFANNLFAGSNGNVGIGTVSPTEMLTLGGNILIGSQQSRTSNFAKVSNATAGTIASGGTSAINSVRAMAVFNGSLYVGTSKTDGAEIYRYDGGTTWTKVSQSTAGTIASGGTANIDFVRSLVVYNGHLYAGTQESASAEVYRYDGGTTWTRVTFGAGQITSGGRTAIDRIPALAVANGNLYLGTDETNAAEVYRYDGGTTWTQINTTDGNICGQASVDGVREGMAVYDNKLYVVTDESNATEVCRYDGGTTWTRVTSAAGTITSGGTASIDTIRGGVAVYNGALYIGTVEANSAEIYRYDGGTTWTKVSQATAGTIASGGTTSIEDARILLPYNGKLYAGTNKSAAAEVYEYTAYEGQSYSLMFNGVSDNGGGEQNGFLNTGSISFAAEQSGQSSTYNAATGSFLFSHGINGVSGSYDIAEDYGTRDDSLGAGDLVSVDTGERTFVKKTGEAYDSTAIGVISEKPGLRLSQKDSTINGGRAVPVALAGRVPVKVTDEGGAIRPGDHLTSSSTPGHAMKTSAAGPAIGIALEGFSGETGKIEMFVNPTYYVPSGDSLVQSSSASFGDLNVSGTATINELTVTGTLRVADLYIDGHIVTGGDTPTAEAGDDAGATSSIDIEGNDTAGSVQITLGGDAGRGVLAKITFKKAFSGRPRVNLTPSSADASELRYYVVATSEGFEIRASQQPTAGEYEFDYFVVE